MNKTGFKKRVYKLLPKFVVLFFLIFAFDMLLNHLTLADIKDTLFDFDRIPVTDIGKDKKRQRWRTGYFDFEDKRRGEKIPYGLELELNSKVEGLKLDILLNESIVACAHIQEKGITVINIPFDNGVLRAGNRIQIRSGRIRWKLNKISLVRRKGIREGKVQTDFHLQNRDLKNPVSYTFEIRVSTISVPLHLHISLNNSQLKKVRLNQPGPTKFVISIDKEQLKHVNHLDIYSEQTGWLIERIALIKDYGFLGGLFFVNLIKKEPGATHPGWTHSFPSYEKFILLLLLWILAALILVPAGKVCRGNAGDRIKINKLEYMIVIAWGVFAALPFLASLLTSHKMIYSVQTIFLLLVIPILLAVYHKRSVLMSKKIIIPAIIFSAFLVSALHEVNMDIHQKDFSGLIRIKAGRIQDFHKQGLGIPTEKLVIRECGYDGQFFYTISFDPFLTKFEKPETYKELIDNPPYRYSRVGFPLLINIFSLGNKAIFPEVMLLLIIFSHLFAAYFLLRILEYHELNPLLTFLYLLIPGYIWSLRMVLPESIAGVFLLAGFYNYLKKKPGLCIFFLTCAVLVRETVLIFVITFILYRLIKYKEIKTPFLFTAPVVPLILWRIYLAIRFHPLYGLSVFCSHPNNFTLPFYGFYQTYQALISGTYRCKQISALGFIFPVLLTLILLLALRLLIAEINITNMALFLYALMSVALNFEKIWGNIGNGIRVTYEVFLFLILSFITRKTGRDRVFFYIIFFLVFVSGFFYPPQLRLLSFGLIR